MQGQIGPGFRIPAFFFVNCLLPLQDAGGSPLAGSPLALITPALGAEGEPHKYTFANQTTE
jgi:hypothetical protein